MKNSPIQSKMKTELLNLLILKPVKISSGAVKGLEVGSRTWAVKGLEVGSRSWAVKGWGAGLGL